ncbi:AAA family ATPase [Paenibacillus humicola]|uniref:AAA family ATPase n=1 Tax=Paenibacillus humicola TaxID=3110540 RepID=UPI00237AE602|nr:AAA family ATPase [Paenibacillus humicola]
MSKQQFVIAVKEADYIERLGEYIRHSPFGEQWQMTAFTNRTAFRHFIRAGYPIHFIAAQSHMLEELEDRDLGVPTAALVMRTGECPGRPEILQYQPLPRLLQAVSAVCAAAGVRPEGGVSGGKAAVAAVYSASGGIGKTTLALHLSQLAGVRGMRVFYLNLEPWNATSLWFGDEASDDLPYMLYTLQTQPDKSALRLTELRRRHPAMGLDYFAPCGNPDELLELSPDNARLLIDTIAGSGQYDLVVADTGWGLNRLHVEVLLAADYPLWLVGRDEVSRRKTEAALRYAERKWGRSFEEAKRRFRFLLAGEGSRASGFDERLKIRFDGEIPFVEEWRRAGEPFGAQGSAAYRTAAEALLGRAAASRKEG